MAKLIFKKPVSMDEMLNLLKRAGISVNEKQAAFLRDHSQHVGLSIEGGAINRLYCRTCNVRDS
jgi:sulfatase maturation enzyme AslB (radical SAM superfamily)